MKKVFYVLLSILVFTGCSSEKEKGTFSSMFTFMGTFVEIKLAGNTASDASRIVEKVILEAKKEEKNLSVFDEESELNRLNINKTIKNAPSLYYVIDEAVKINKLTGGEFDIRVAPVLKKAGFYKNMPESLLNRIPDTYTDSGDGDIELNLAEQSISIRDDAWLDLSGIAKGYIVDKIAGSLTKNGFSNMLVNAGGDMFCGEKPGGEPWVIGIRTPGEKKIIAVVKLKNMAVATSGDYENVVLKNDEKYSHIINPEEGSPVPEDFSSVTVITGTCMRADALATGMMAMGKEQALALADELEGVYIIFVVPGPGGGFIAQTSRGADSFLVKR